MERDPHIQISEKFTQFMSAPSVEVVAWWSLDSVDRYRFSEVDPGRNILRFETGCRRYETEYGTVTELVTPGDIPFNVIDSLADTGYSLISKLQTSG